MVQSSPSADADDFSSLVTPAGLELARDIAMASVETCRRDGYNVSAVVPDRAGNVQAALRDTLAARHTQEIAERRARMSIMSGTHSGEFRAAGSLIGAVGVSGAPGGEKDAAVPPLR